MFRWLYLCSIVVIFHYCWCIRKLLYITSSCSIIAISISMRKTIILTVICLSLSFYIYNADRYSGWSDWIGPIVPQPGVYVLEFNREERSARVGWFKPLLSAGRKVDFFEAQMAQLDGPIEKSVSVMGDKVVETGGVLDYKTLQVSRSLRFKGLFLYTVGILCDMELCIAALMFFKHTS